MYSWDSACMYLGMYEGVFGNTKFAFEGGGMWLFDNAQTLC